MQKCGRIAHKLKRIMMKPPNRQFKDEEVLIHAERFVNEFGLNNALMLSQAIQGIFLALYKDKMSEKEIDDFLTKANKASKELAKALKTKG